MNLVSVIEHRSFMFRYRAIYAPPPRRWTFGGYGVWRRHEHFFNLGKGGC